MIDLESIYYKWLYQHVFKEGYFKSLSYKKLIKRLYDTPFTYTITMDRNRAEDGIDLRYRFGYMYNYERDIVAKYLDNKLCSVLEMMLALSIRMEEHIMDDPNLGDRSGQWFWDMIVNLGLGGMDDIKFNSEYVDAVIYKLLNRQYEPNGENGLFTLKHCAYDLRTVEIWYQANWYLVEFLKHNGGLNDGMYSTGS